MEVCYVAAYLDDFEYTFVVCCSIVFWFFLSFDYNLVVILLLPARILGSVLF